MKLLIHIIKYFNKRAGKGRGTKIKSDKKAGATTKKVMSPGVPGGGWGQNNLTGGTRRLHPKVIFSDPFACAK